jgi:hypothetical protein
LNEGILFWSNKGPTKKKKKKASLDFDYLVTIASDLLINAFEALYLLRESARYLLIYFVN